MYNANTVITSFKPQIKFFVDEFESEELVTKLSGDLVGTSNNGMYLNTNTHPLIENWKNITSCFPNFSTNYSTYSPSDSYSIGKLVYDIDTRSFYKSKQNNNINQDITNTVWWMPFNPLQNELNKQIDNAILTVLKDTVPNNCLIDSQLARRIGNKTNDKCEIATLDTGEFDYQVCGIKIKAKQNEQYKVIVINKIGLHFDGIKKIKIYVSQGNTIVFNQEFTTMGTYQWFNLGNNITLTGDIPYYIYYYESALDTSVNPIKSHINAIGKNCTIDTMTYKHAEVNFFRTPTADFDLLTNETLLNNQSQIAYLPCEIDESNFTYNQNNNYGLNIQFVVKEDYTELICQNFNLFYNAIHLAFSLKILELMAINENVRDNPNQRNAIKNAGALIYETKANKNESDYTIKNKFVDEIEKIKNTLGNVKVEDKPLPAEKKKKLMTINYY